MDTKWDRVCESFQESGFAIMENFFTETELADMRNECAKLIQQFDPATDPGSVFVAGSSQTFEQYFLESNDKVRYFMESNAWDKTNNRLAVDKELCLNKIGHALHWHNSIFKRITFDQRFKSLVKTLKMMDPVIVQSMIIFKNPFIGSEVPAHQDASYLYCTPKPNVVGFWIPLEDATESNGCLQFIPGSHKTHPLGTRWARQYGPSGQMKIVHTNENVHYKGDFVSLEAPKGSCVLIDGLVVHRSNANKSSRPRPIYSFHLYDRGTCDWNELNWLQASPSLPFPALYDVVV